MSLSHAIQDLLCSDEPAAFDEFAAHLDAEWLDTALKATGKMTVRRRAMPAPIVVWLVVGMALFRNLSIAEVVRHLGLSGLGGQELGRGRVAKSSISEARDRLGEEPMAWLFAETGKQWAAATAEENRWQGLSLYATDGTTLRVQDTEENRQAFCLPGSGRGQSGYPQVRVVALMAVRSHVLAAAAMGPCCGKQTGEQSLARELWGLVPDHSVTIADKGFLDYGQLHALQISGSERHWLVRAKKNLRWETVRELGAGDYLVQVKTSSTSRRGFPELPREFQCRAICYQADNGEPQWLLTSLLDDERYPALEIAQLYHERWEIELGYDEIKTHMLERQEALRSKRPVKVRQEIWGILLAYNLVRMKMATVAAKLDLPSTRLSFTHTLRLVRMFCELHAWVAAPSKLLSRIEDLEDMIEMLVIPPRRTERRYPRHVKIKMSKFKRNAGRPAAATEA